MTETGKILRKKYLWKHLTTSSRVALKMLWGERRCWRMRHSNSLSTPPHEAKTAKNSSELIIRKVSSCTCHDDVTREHLWKMTDSNASQMLSAQAQLWQTIHTGAGLINGKVGTCLLCSNKLGKMIKSSFCYCDKLVALTNLIKALAILINFHRRSRRAGLLSQNMILAEIWAFARIYFFDEDDLSEA